MIGYFKKFHVWVLGFVGITLFFTAFGDRGLFQIYKLRKKLRALEKENVFLAQDNTKLSDNIHRMKKEKNFQERSAREALGLVKEDEVIYEFSP